MKYRAWHCPAKSRMAHSQDLCLFYATPCRSYRKPDSAVGSACNHFAVAAYNQIYTDWRRELLECPSRGVGKTALHMAPFSSPVCKSIHLLPKYTASLVIRGEKYSKEPMPFRATMLLWNRRRDQSSSQMIGRQYTQSYCHRETIRNLCSCRHLRLQDSPDPLGVWECHNIR